MVNRRRLIFSALLFCSAGFAAAADLAVVVGINKYPKLELGDLNGCVADAESMAKVLEGRGFQIVRVMDTMATKAAILRALGNAKSRCGARDRFVFYFAGHGSDSRDGKCVILPHDALETSQANDITAKELEAAIRAVPAGAKTVLLDSCFSGGMLTSSKGLKRFKTRYHPRKLASSKDIGSNDAGTNANLSLSSDICYFAASRNNEQAHETEIKGVDHGVFTYYLTERIKTPGMSWGAMQTKVGGQVAKETEDLQHPTLTPSFSSKEVLAAPPDPVNPTSVKPPDPLPEISVWDRYNEDRPDATKIRLAMEPNLTTLKVGEHLSFTATCGMDGYLVIIERGTSGGLQLLYPATKDVDAARVVAGQEIKTGKFYPDSPGSERIKAILFAFKSDAEDLMESVPLPRSTPGGKGLEPEEATHLKLKVDPANSASFYTSDFIFEVVPKEAAFLDFHRWWLRLRSTHYSLTR